MMELIFLYDQSEVVKPQFSLLFRCLVMDTCVKVYIYTGLTMCRYNEMHLYMVSIYKCI